MKRFGTTGSTAERTDRRGDSAPVVLLVEDYADCREMYAACLTLAGFRVLKARDGIEALQLAATSPPDLVLMDLGLPVMDGIETARRLKSHMATRDIPVIALTAQSITEPDRLRAAGFAGLMTKPCLPDDLAEVVWRTLGRERPVAATS
jgi:two-component system, cell cycle response regulator DivK